MGFKVSLSASEFDTRSTNFALGLRNSQPKAAQTVLAKPKYKIYFAVSQSAS